MNKKLIKEFHEKVNELVGSLKHLKFNINNYDSKASIKIGNILKKNGYKAIGGGSYRAVYSREDVPFVIKVGFSAEGMLSNKREALAASNYNKSQNIKSILPHLYYHDKNFAWVIFEKVIPISRYVKDINKEYNVIAKVFPTFHRIFFSSNSYHHKPKSEHLYLITDVISKTFYYIVKDGVKDYNLIINKIKEEFPSYGTIQDWNKDIERIVSEEPMEDIKRFIKSSSIDNTLDISANNIGRRYSDNPSPKDIVILDFDDSPQYSKNVLPVKNKKDAVIVNTNVDDYRKSKAKANDLYDEFDYWEPSDSSKKDYESDDDEWDYPVSFSDWKLKNQNENVTKNIISKLLKEFYKKETDIASKLKEIEENPKSWSVYNDLYDVLKEEGYDIIGSGHSRVVFSKSDVPFVVKLAAYPDSGISANKSEILLSNKASYSNQVSSILPELYSYSEDKKPMWIICEKVTPIEKVSIETLFKSFPTLYYFAKQKTLNDGTVIARDLQKNEFLSLINNVFYNIASKSHVNINIALSIIGRACKIIYSEKYDLIKIKDTLPLLDIRRFIESTSYDYTMDLHLGNLGIRNERDINPNSFVILDFDPKAGIIFSKKNIRHTFDENPDHPNHPDRDAKLIGNIDNSKPPREPNWSAIMSAEVNRKNESFAAEAVYKRLIMEASKQKRSKNRSHPGDSYEYGWPEFDDSWFDEEGIATWKEDREWTKQWYKRMGLMK